MADSIPELPKIGAPPEPPAPVPSPPEPRALPTETHPVKEFAHNEPLFGCRFDPLGRYVVAGAQGNHLIRWELESGTKTLLAGHTSWIRGIAFSHDGQTVISGGYDGRLIWWPLTAEKPQAVRTLDAHKGWVRTVVVSPDGQTVGTCGNDNLIKLWSIIDGTLVRQIAGHDRHVYNIAFHPDGKTLVSADLMGVIKLWDVASGKELKTYDGSAMHKYDPTFRADIGGSRSMAFSPDGKYFACGSITKVTNAFAGVGSPIVALYDVEKEKPIQQLMLKGGGRGVAWGLVYHPEGFLVGCFAGSNAGQLVFFRPEESTPFHQLKLSTVARDIDLGPDGMLLAVAQTDNKLKLFRMAKKPAAPAKPKKA